VKSALFNDINKLVVFGLNAPRMNMKKDGTIVIPFYVNAEDEDVKVTIKDDIGNTLHTQTISGVTGKKVYIYTLNLSEVTVISAALFLRATIEVGTTTTEKIYKVLRLPNYEVKEVVFQNNFGYYIPAYFDGDFEDTSGYKVQSYERYDTSTAVYAVEESGTYIVNTGGLSIKEKDIVNEIANSIECFFKNGTEYKRVNTATKKSTNLKSRLNIYSEDLAFTFSAGLPFSNLNLADDVSALALNLISINSLGSSNYEVEFDANFPLFQVFSRVRTDETTAWSAPLLFPTSVSPQERIVSLGTSFQIVLHAVYNSTIVYSNILTYSE
jgi:hypothetical protein